MSTPESNSIEQVFWFITMGWWITQLLVIGAWAVNLLIITSPLALAWLKYLPDAFTRPEAIGHSAKVVRAAEVPQRPLLLRAVYFLFVGWWLSLIWLEIAWLAGLTLVLNPQASAMFSKLPAITTLRQQTEHRTVRGASEAGLSH